ncbi:hypothetical protein ABCW43_18160 [Neorhizobium sp. IRAMC:178]|uniref:hypothetical protein n=1 Tax=Neorhizobium tunisiense TaxID=3144793 RepID=UPI0031F6C6A8
MPRFIERMPTGGYGYLSTVPSHVKLVAECLACGVQREMDRAALNKAVRGLEGISEMGKRLRCEACGRKNGKLMTGYYAE